MSSSSLDFMRWAREQRPRRGLPRPEGHMLRMVASFSNQRGECEASVETIANALGYSRQHAHKLLKRLDDRGLIITRRRVGKPAIRRLNVDAPHHDQLALDASSAGEKCDIRMSPPALSHVSHGGDTKDLEGRSSGEARAHDDDEDASAEALHPRLAEVLAIFEALPDPYRHVEPMSIDAALRAYPDHDVVGAAHIVASKVHGGQAFTSHVNSLLLGVLRRMPKTTGAPAPAASSSHGGGGRPSGRKAKSWDGALARAMEAGA